jgi:hypothetical protein
MRSSSFVAEALLSIAVLGCGDDAAAPWLMRRYLQQQAGMPHRSRNEHLVTGMPPDRRRSREGGVLAIVARPCMLMAFVAAVASSACYVPVANHLPPSDRAETMGRVHSRSYSLDPPRGRWREVGFQSTAPGGYGSAAPRLPVRALGVVSVALHSDSLPGEANEFCHFPRLRWAGDREVSGESDRCLGIVAQPVPDPPADTSRTLQRIRAAWAAARPLESGTCAQVRGRGDYRFNTLEPVLVDTTLYYALAERCEADSALVSAQPQKALIRVTTTRVYSFLFTDGTKGPGSDEWRVLSSFRPE